MNTESRHAEWQARLDDLAERIWHRYGVHAAAHMRSPAAVADLVAWARLGRGK